MGLVPLPSASGGIGRGGWLINRGFALLWTGQVVTDLGTVVFNTALVIWVAAVLAPNQTWAPLAVSGLLLAQSVPMLLVRPLAGVYVDRWDVRNTMLRMDAVRASLVALLLVPLALPLGLAWRLAATYAVVLLVSACTQFFNPALLALIDDLVPEAELARASGLSEITWNTASVLGPPLAAPLVLGFGMGWVLPLNAASFAVSYLAVTAIRSKDFAPERPESGSARDTASGRASVRADGSPTHAGRARPSILRDLREGMHFVAVSQTVRTVTVAIAIAMLGAGMLHALDYFFVTQNLHALPAYYGLVGPAFGGGSIVGALLAGWTAPRLGVARTFVWSLVGVGCTILVLARQSSLAPALAIWVLFGVFNASANVALTPLLLGATPRALVGRMNALFFTAISAASLLSSTLAGWLDSSVLRGFSSLLFGMRFGPVDTLITLTGLLICGAGLYAAVRLPFPADRCSG